MKITGLSETQVTKESTLGDFLNPKTAIALSAMSSMVIAFTTTLGNAFNFNLAYTALGLSLLFAWFQVENSTIQSAKIQMKLFYVFVTAMVIFHVARGGNMSLVSAERAIKDASTTELTSHFPSIVQSSLAGEENTNAAFFIEGFSKPITNEFVTIVAPSNSVKEKIFKPW